MLQHVVEYLSCPHCGARPALDGAVLRCPAGHSFDVARQGYVNLLPGGAHTGTGDTAGMVAARADFLGAGHYSPIAAALADAAEEEARGDRAAGCVLDLGAGTGTYLAAVLDRLPHACGLALDVSKFALRRAAGAHPRLGAVVSDAWRPLPVRSAVAGLVLNVFAPRNGPEIHRLLRPGGTLLVVSPTPRHLRELVAAAGLLSVDADKGRRIEGQLGPHLRACGRAQVEYRLALGHADALTAVAMGPSARHIDPAELAARIGALPEPFGVTVSVTLARYRRSR